MAVLAAAVLMILKVALEHLDKVITADVVHISQTTPKAAVAVAVQDRLAEIILMLLVVLVGLVQQAP